VGLAGLEPAASSYRVLHPGLFPQDRIGDLRNDAPLETVANRSVPMACGPNVDQGGVPFPSGRGCLRRFNPPRLGTELAGHGKADRCRRPSVAVDPPGSPERGAPRSRQRTRRRWRQRDDGEGVGGPTGNSAPKRTRRSVLRQNEHLNQAGPVGFGDDLRLLVLIRL
jgi:hypothetical protein